MRPHGGCSCCKEWVLSLKPNQPPEKGHVAPKEDTHLPSDWSLREEEKAGGNKLRTAASCLRPCASESGVATGGQRCSLGCFLRGWGPVVMATSIPALQAAWTMLCRSQVYTAPGMAEAIQAKVIKDQGTAPAWTNHPLPFYSFFFISQEPSDSVVSSHFRQTIEVPKRHTPASQVILTCRDSDFLWAGVWKEKRVWIWGEGLD